MCSFSSETRRCDRCGYIAQELPFFRMCLTLEEEARKIVEDHAFARINVPPIPLGDAAAAVLKSIGLTKERLKQAIGKDCGCEGRQNAMNRIGSRLSRGVSDAANALLNVVAPHPVTTEDVVAVANAMAKHPGTNPGLIAPPPPATPAADLP